MRNLIDDLVGTIEMHNKHPQRDHIANRQRIRLASRSWGRHQLVTLWPQGRYEGTRFVADPTLPFALCMWGPHATEWKQQGTGPNKRYARVPATNSYATVTGEKSWHCRAIIDPKELTYTVHRVGWPNSELDYMGYWVPTRPEWGQLNRHTASQCIAKVGDEYVIWKVGLVLQIQKDKWRAVNGETPIIVEPTREGTQRLKAALAKMRDGYGVAAALHASYPQPDEHPLYGRATRTKLSQRHKHDHDTLYGIVKKWIDRKDAVFEPRVYLALLAMRNRYYSDFHLGMCTLKRRLRIEYSGRPYV